MDYLVYGFIVLVVVLAAALAVYEYQQDKKTTAWMRKNFNDWDRKL